MVDVRWCSHGNNRGFSAADGTATQDPGGGGRECRESVGSAVKNIGTVRRSERRTEDLTEKSRTFLPTFFYEEKISTTVET